MRGLYLNTNYQALASSFAFFAENNSMIEEMVFSHQLALVYVKDEWPNAPVYATADGSGRFYCYGWFVYNNQRNNLVGLAEDYLQQGVSVFDQIEHGVFAIVYITHDDVKVIVDRYGISSHYIRRGSTTTPLIEIAPSIKAFDNLLPPNPILTKALKSQRHLFGNYTIFDDIERIEPASQLSLNGEMDIYSQVNFKLNDPKLLEEIPELISQLISYWPESSRTLAISGGLDSRLALAKQRFAFGYTYGPENSGDRIVARQFADCFDRYHEFGFDRPEKLAEEPQLAENFFFGSVKWMPRLLSVYHYSFKKAQGAYVFFDGYSGDAYSRGTFLKFNGFIGSLVKLFPFLHKIGFSERTILKKRYSSLDDEAFALLWNDYQQRTKHIDTSNYQKITYYEGIYGRGARYALTGGVLAGGQMFMSVPIFFSRQVFERLISQNTVDALQYKLLSKIWKNVAKRFADAKTETGYSPSMPFWLIPFSHIVNRIFVHYVPGYETYSKNMEKEEKDI